MFNVDKKIEKLGFIQVSASPRLVNYEKTDKEINFTHCVDIHVFDKDECYNDMTELIFSYDKDDNRFCGLTSEESMLFVKKAKQMRRRMTE